jgi:hypothetical protein
MLKYLCGSRVPKKAPVAKGTTVRNHLAHRLWTVNRFELATDEWKTFTGKIMGISKGGMGCSQWRPGAGRISSSLVGLFFFREGASGSFFVWSFCFEEEFNPAFVDLVLLLFHFREVFGQIFESGS